MIQEIEQNNKFDSEIFVIDSVKYSNFSATDSDTIYTLNKENISIEAYQVIDNDFKFNISKNEIDKGVLTNKAFNYIRNKAFIDHYKKIFNSEFKKIQAQISLKDRDLTDRDKYLATVKSFRSFLDDRGINIDKKNHVVDTIVKDKERWKVTTNAKEYGYDKSVVFYVNDKDIRNNTLFISDKKLESLIRKAIDRDKKDNELIDLSRHSIEKKVLETPKVKKEITQLKLKVDGLKEPLLLEFTEEQISNNKIPRFIYNKEYTKALEKGIKQEFGNVREDIKLKVWSEKGYDTRKRKLTVDDLLYYAKLEETRVFSGNDKEVKHNETIDKEIEQLKNDNKRSSNKQIRELENSYLKHKSSGKVIKVGDMKEGDNTHIHIVLSRSDKFSVNPKDKVGVSPLVSRKGLNGNDGIERTEFFKKAEALFDNMYDYKRPVFEKIEHKLGNRVEAVGKRILSKIVENLGYNEIRQELNVKNQLKNDLIGNIPLNVVNPVKLVAMAKNPVKLGIEIVKQISRL
jgi:hypothetical protein